MRSIPRRWIALALVAVLVGPVAASGSSAQAQRLHVDAMVIGGTAGSTSAAVLVIAYTNVYDRFRAGPPPELRQLGAVDGLYGCIWMVIGGRTERGCADMSSSQASFDPLLLGARASFSARSETGKLFTADVSLSGGPVVVPGLQHSWNTAPELPDIPSWMGIAVIAAASRLGTASGVITSSTGAGGRLREVPPTDLRPLAYVQQAEAIAVNAYPR